jgi:hypothetical protein
MSAVDFSEAGVLEDARAATGLDDFGDDSFRPGLRALLETYDRNPFSEKGRERTRRRTVGLLAGRQRIESALARHPEILERPIRAPMVLTGLPRSGTSALFNLLASDAAARPLLLWESQFPDPAEGLAPGDPDPRHQAVKAYYDRGREKNPEWSKVHYTGADTPEECVLIHAFALHGVQYGIEIMLEPYASWYREQVADLRPLYAYHKKILQLLDWQRPGERWLLKAPAHMWGLDALVATYPDVSIVWSHRNPLACTASACSMTAQLMATIEDLDREKLGPVVMEFYAESLDRGLAVREGLDPRRFVDVSHDDFVADSLGTADRIYTHFGIPLTDPVRGALRAHVDANPRGRHGSHDYGLEEFGLTPERVRERFARYIDRFQIALD